MMRLLIAVPLAIAIGVIWLPLVSEIICLFRRSSSTRREARSATQSRLLFLVPAHNEELFIQKCVGSLLALDYPPHLRETLVIADNCTDATAALVRAAGAQCLERHDPAHGGKPQAIAWALQQLDMTRWDAFVIVDADTVVPLDFARALDGFAPLNGIALQANFRVLNEEENWLTRLGGLLSRCRYDVTYPLKQSAGLNCPITGNGMGFGTGLLASHGWNASSITEDSELYAEYTAAGIRIVHAHTANVYSQEEASLRQSTTQRRRWLAGRLLIMRKWGKELLSSRKISWHQKLDIFVELTLSSPILHGVAALILGVAAVLLLPGALGWVLGGLALLSLTGTAISTAIALTKHPKPWKTLGAFVALPIYVVWRVGILGWTLISLRDKKWKRTTRTMTTEKRI